MTKSEPKKSGGVLGLIFSPFVLFFKAIHKHFLAYLFSRTLRDEDRIYSIKFVWYGDTVYLHPMTWGSLLLYFAAQAGRAEGWLLLIWFCMLGVSYLAVMYNFDVIRMAILIVGLVAVFGLAYISKNEYNWNPFSVFSGHLRSLDAKVSPGFYLVSCYLFSALIFCEVVWAWLFQRVEIDESYVYEHRFLRGTAREPIFSRGLKRETKDLLELLLLGAGDIMHRTRNGVKRFKNVPLASLGLGVSIDSLLDYRRRGQVALERRQKEEEGADARVEDAFPDTHEDDWHDDDHGGDDHSHDDGGDDDHDGF